MYISLLSDALNQTTKWIQQSLKCAAEAKSQDHETNENGVPVDNLSPTLVLNSGFSKILDLDYDSAVPEVSYY